MKENNRRKALGRGLEELFSNERLDINTVEKQIIEESSKEEIVDINLSDLRSNPYQPRKVFDEEALSELASSIREHGIFQPIIVKDSIKGYEIVAGERRVKAAGMAGLNKIPAIVRNFTDQQMMELALLENLQRENLSVIEEAEAYEKLLKNLNTTQDKLAKRLGKSRSHITNILGLLKLPSSVKDLLLHNELSMGHARVLSKLDNDEQIIDLCDQILNKALSVRELEELATDTSFKRKKEIIRKAPSKEYKPLEERLNETLGTRVHITDRKVEIYFTSKHDLNRILDIMKLNED